MHEDRVNEELAIIQERSAVKGIDKNLFTKPIAEVCHRPIASMDEDASIQEAIDFMRLEKIGSVLIVKKEKLVGIVTERDILTKVNGTESLGLPISTIMTRNPTWLLKKDSIAHLMNKMYSGYYRHIPILDEAGKPIHMVSLRDILNYIFEAFPEDIINIPSDPYRGPVKRYGA